MAGLAGDWQVLEGTDVFGTSGVRFEQLPDRSYIPRGDNPTTVAYYFSAQTELKGITGIRAADRSDVAADRAGPGDCGHGVVVGIRDRGGARR